VLNFQGVKKSPFFPSQKHRGVSKNRGIPKWMVKIMEKPYEQMDDLGVKPTISGNPHRWKKSSGPTTLDVLRRALTVGTTRARAILPFASRTTRPRPTKMGTVQR